LTGDELQPSTSKKVGNCPDPRFLLFELPIEKRLIAKKDLAYEESRLFCSAQLVFTFFNFEELSEAKLLIVVGLIYIPWITPALFVGFDSSTKLNSYIVILVFHCGDNSRTFKFSVS
jgi:hypothetical protein